MVVVLLLKGTQPLVNSRRNFGHSLFESEEKSEEDSCRPMIICRRCCSLGE